MIDLAAFLLTIIGYGLNARKLIICWSILIAGNILWIIHFIMHDQLLAMAMNAVILLINIYGWYSWLQEGQKPRKNNNNDLESNN